jgi:hypothetical protein
MTAETTVCGAWRAFWVCSAWPVSSDARMPTTRRTAAAPPSRTTLAHKHVNAEREGPRQY